MPGEGKGTADHSVGLALKGRLISLLAGEKNPLVRLFGEDLSAFSVTGTGIAG